MRVNQNVSSERVKAKREIKILANTIYIYLKKLIELSVI